MAIQQMGVGLIRGTGLISFDLADRIDHRFID